MQFYAVKSIFLLYFIKVNNTSGRDPFLKLGISVHTHYSKWLFTVLYYCYTWFSKGFIINKKYIKLVIFSFKKILKKETPSSKFLMSHQKHLYFKFTEIKKKRPNVLLKMTSGDLTGNAMSK